MTSNKSVTEWSGMVQDASLAAAIIDRLMHHGQVFYLKGPSWRLRGRVLDAQEASGARSEAARSQEVTDSSSPSTPAVLDSFIPNQSQDAAKGNPS